MPNSRSLYEDVIEKNLCTLCGTCIGVCSVFTLENDKIVADHSRCNTCGRCVSVCPGADFSYPKFNEMLFAISNNYIISEDIGKYTGIYRGWATDEVIRSRGSSGGAVSAVLCALLSEKYIDGAVVIGERNDSVGEYGAFIAKTEEEILSAAQSKYQFVPVNELIRDVLKMQGKYAFVGLPCQVHGLRKAMDENAVLKERIAYILGIFCGFNMHKDATDYLIKKSGISRSQIKSLEYRGKYSSKYSDLIRNQSEEHKEETGFKITSSTGEIFFVNKHSYTFMNLFFCSSRCMKCYDFTAEFADISFGDAWEEKKCTRIIVRTECGSESLKIAMRNYLYAEDSSEEAIKTTQMQLINHKKKYISVRAKLFPDFPDYGIVFSNIFGIEKIKAAIFYIVYWLCSSPFGKISIRLFPIKLLGWLSSLLRDIFVGNYKTVMRYFVFGVCTVLLNFLLFNILNLVTDFRIANLVSIIATKCFAFYTNKTYVFETKTKTIMRSVKEFVRFLTARGFTGLIEFFGMILMVQFWMLNENFSKAVLIAITTVLNYILGKTKVFYKE